MSRLTYIATVTIDGKTYKFANAVTFNPGGIAKTPEVHGGKTYYTGEEMPALIKGTLLHDKDADIIAQGEIEGANVLVQANTGQKWIVRNAETKDPLEVDLGTGKAPFEMFGDKADRM
ncbi:phage tail tube protein [Sulfuriflexus mobilis]|uniref:phage tail tube protein n=1 Tax=Sulfuriflexus mobilis TaxID=1811807 RepID=UPI000F826452|nr:phage tail tube protein [Sulfuriflexus mobilis]